MSEQQAPNVLQFSHVRDYLQAYVAFQKQATQRWSISAWSRKVGVGDPSTLTKVLNGNRKIGPKLARKVSESLGLIGPEQRHFMMLTKLSEAPGKDCAFSGGVQIGEEAYDLRQDESIERLRGTEKSISLFYDWYVVAIRELFLNPHLALTKREIAKILRPEISVHEVERTLELLEDIGEIEAVGRHRWRSRQVQIETMQDVSIAAIRRYQRRCLDLEKVAIDVVANDQREFQTLTFAYQLRDLPRIKRKIRVFKQDILDEFEVKEQFAESPYVLAQFHMGLFPISRIIASDKTN